MDDRSTTPLRDADAGATRVLLVGGDACAVLVTGPCASRGLAARFAAAAPAFEAAGRRLLGAVVIPRPGGAFVALPALLVPADAGDPVAAALRALRREARAVEGAA